MLVIAAILQRFCRKTCVVIAKMIWNNKIETDLDTCVMKGNISC